MERERKRGEKRELVERERERDKERYIASFWSLVTSVNSTTHEEC